MSKDIRKSAREEYGENNVLDIPIKNLRQYSHVGVVGDKLILYQQEAGFNDYASLTLPELENGRYWVMAGINKREEFIIVAIMRR